MIDMPVIDVMYEAMHTGMTLIKQEDLVIIIWVLKMQIVRLFITLQ
jgi:hypothetical protein